MAINFTVNADVIDISKDNPKPEDSFLVDTNVWYWMTYNRASLSVNHPLSYQVRSYPTYVNNAIKAKSKLFCCSLSFAELAHLIEKTEYDIFSKTSSSPIKPKEFRHNYPVERNNVVAEIDTSWGQVVTMSSLFGFTMDEQITNRAATRLKTQLLDGYDVFMIELINELGSNKVITDDGDYATVPGLQVFTANRNIIEAAGLQRRLVTR